jgi:hypothetical protein
MKASEFRSLIKEQVKKVLSEALNAVDSKLLTNHETLTPAVYRNLMLNAKKGILKHMTQPDGKIHFWNPATKEYVAKLITYNGKGEYLYSNAIDKAGNLVEGINEDFDASKMKVKDTIELKNSRTGNVGTYTIKRILGGSSNIKEIEVLNRSNQPLTLYYSKEKGLQNFKGDVYEYITENKLSKLGINENVDATVKKLENLIKSQFTIIDFKAPAKRTSSNEEFLMVKVKDDKYGGPESGLGKVIKKHTGVKASFIDNYGNDKVYWVSLEKIENSPVSGINESAMSDVDQMAKDASTFNQFAMEFFKEYPNIKQDEKMGFVKWLKTVYMDARNNK